MTVKSFMGHTHSVALYLVTMTKTNGQFHKKNSKILIYYTRGIIYVCSPKPFLLKNRSKAKALKRLMLCYAPICTPPLQRHAKCCSLACKLLKYLLWSCRNCCRHFKKRLVVKNKLCLLLKIILNNTRTLQLFTINIIN